MSRGRGGYGGRRRPRASSASASDGATNGIRGDSSIQAGDNETSPENTNTPITNSSSRSNTTQVLHNQTLGDTRTRVYVLNGVFANSSECSRKITKIFKERIDDKAYTWGKMTPNTKNFYYSEFKKYFVWEPENEKEVRDAWDAKASQRYTDFMRELRAKMIKPDFITENVWRGFQDYWGTPEYKEKQDINKENRLKGEGSSTHTGGSISYVEIAHKLESILGHPPTEFELFLYTHSKDHDNHTFINDRSKEINDKMLRLREAHQTANPPGEDGSQQVNESALYYEAASGKRKREVYGNGSKAFVYLNPGSWTSLTSNKPDETWKNKYLTTETKLRKLTRKTDTLKQTLAILCSRLDVPTPDFDSDDEDSDKEGSSGHANQNQNTNHSEEAAIASDED